MNQTSLAENSKLGGKHRKMNYWSKVEWRFWKSNVVKPYYMNFNKLMPIDFLILGWKNTFWALVTFTDKQWSNSISRYSNLRLSFINDFTKLSSAPVLGPKIQQTNMLVTCQRFGDLFLFELMWQYSSNHKTYNKSRFKVIATYLKYLYYMFCD